MRIQLEAHKHNMKVANRARAVERARAEKAEADLTRVTALRDAALADVEWLIDKLAREEWWDAVLNSSADPTHAGLKKYVTGVRERLAAARARP
jgi:hypothetical protein